MRVAAICDLNVERLHAAGDTFGVERRFTDYRRMLGEVDLDAVYVIMPPQYSLQIVLDCLDAGKHVLVEKPPATSARNLELMAAAAERNRRVTAVGFQRRYSLVARQVRDLILERGPVTLCIGEFHKNKLGSGSPAPGTSLLLDHIDHVIHAVDFVRYMCGGEPVETHIFRDSFFEKWPNAYHALVRFSTGAVACLSANCTSLPRFLRFEVHGKGICAQMEMPKSRFSARLWANGVAQPRILAGEGAARAGDTDADATLELHRSFVAGIQTRGGTLSSFRECVGTMRLVEALEGI